VPQGGESGGACVPDQTLTRPSRQIRVRFLFRWRDKRGGNLADQVLGAGVIA
jgi:hypothetical protein